jgi:hypothetical protein
MVECHFWVKSGRKCASTPNGTRFGEPGMSMYGAAVSHRKQPPQHERCVAALVVTTRRI